MEEEVDTLTPEDNLALSNNQIITLWEKHMHDFVPEDMINFLIEADKSVYFYEQISHTSPTLVRGAYYVNGGEEAPKLKAMII